MVFFSKLQDSLPAELAFQVMPPRRVLMPVVPKEEEDPNTPPEREEGGLARTSSTVQARRPSVNGLVGGANWVGRSGLRLAASC